MRSASRATPPARPQRIAHGTPRRISLGRINGRMFAFNAGIGFDAELVRRVDAQGPPGGRQAARATSRSAWTVVRALVDHRFRYESALEVEGLGRAAFALIANCSPYTYAGSLGLRFVPGASFEGGLDIVAPIEVRPRAVPRLATQALRGRPGADDVLVGHDLDRIVIRCDVPLPVQVDGEDIGDIAGGGDRRRARCADRAHLERRVAGVSRSAGDHPLRWLPWRTRSRCRIWARA